MSKAKSAAQKRAKAAAAVGAEAPASPAKAKRREHAHEVAARLSASIAGAREKLGRRATAAEVGDVERAAVAAHDPEPRLIDA